MATATFVHDGKSIDYTPVLAVDAGDVIVQDEMVGVAKLDIAAGALGALAVSGVFDFPKSTGSSSAIVAGDNCYWDASSEVATATASTHKLIGKAVAAAADDDATVRILMNQ